MLTGERDFLSPTSGVPNHVVWDQSRIEKYFPDEVVATAREFHDTPYDELLKPLLKTRSVHESGVGYAVLKEDGDSTEEAAVQFTTYANGLNDGVLLRGAFLSKVLRRSGITDQAGDHLPLIVVASPTYESGIDLNKKERGEIAKGNFEPAAVRYIEIAKQFAGKISIFGYSQGAAVAAASANISSSRNMDVRALVVADPPNVKKRAPLAFFKEHKSEGHMLYEDLLASNIEAFLRAHRLGGSTLRFAARIVAQAPLNYAIFKGLATDSFFKDLKQATINQIPSTIGYGTKSATSPNEAIRAGIHDLRKALPGGRRLIHTVEVEGGYHSWCGRADTMATFYRHGLLNI